MTYDNYLKEMLTKDDYWKLGISWIKLEYYISLKGWANKKVEELENIFINEIGETGTFDEFLSKEGMTRIDFENMYKGQGFRTEEDFLKACIIQRY